MQSGSGTPVTTAYDDAGLPTSSSDGTTYAHDPLGNLTAIDRAGSSDDWFFTYSSWSRLTTAARTPSGSDVTYSLDALDRTLSRTSGGSTATYTYQGHGEVLARSEVAGVATTYAHSPGGPLAQRTGSTTRYYLRDQHGDVIGTANTSAALAGTVLYDPWGAVLSATGELASPPAQGRFGFQSDLTDPETGQVDMLARLYEPGLGRFSSRDLLFGDPATLISLNQFVYGGANPVTFWDSTGMRPECGPGCSAEEQEAGTETWIENQQLPGVEVSFEPEPLTLAEFEALTEAERIEWLDAFTSYYELHDWFEAIRGVLEAGDATSFMDQGTWSSWVDAGILHGIQQGMRIFNRDISASSNPGGAAWATFFTTYFTRGGEQDDSC